MKTLSGKPNNIAEEILGKVTRKGVPFFRKRNAIFIADGNTAPQKGYAAILTDREVPPAKGIAITSVNGLDELYEGDVVLLTCDGSIRVLYDSCSEHHAILVTERCNHNCIMCPQPRVLREEDKTDFHLKLISLWDRKPGNIGLTGGEPTLVGENLFTLIHAMKRRIPMASVSVLTNGVRFSDFGYAKRLAAIRHPDLRVEIPLYAATDTEHNGIVGAGTFYQTIQGLYNLARLHQRIGLRIVIHRQTNERLPQLAEFIYRNLPFVWHVMFMHLEPTGLAADNIQAVWIDPYDCNPALQEAVLYLSRRNMNVSIYNAQLCVLPDVLQPFARQSISEWKNIYLPICTQCTRKTNCAGFFASATDHHSSHIKPFDDDD